MPFRRKISCLVLLIASVVSAATVLADMVKENPMLEIRAMESAARKASLRTNADPTDPDTVWVGHIVGTYSVAWSANPAWTGWGPFHVGRGGYRVANFPSSPNTIGNNGYWDFDRFNAGEADTLQGWNSVPLPYSSISGNVSGDRATRWFFCMDWGNGGNHKGNSFGKKTYGVLSYWHVDGGNTQPAVAIANTSPVTPTWAPIAGAGSAWCGLRAHGDISGTADPITGNYHNSTLVQNYGDNHFRQIDQQNPSGFSDANYPGYGSQWDQILYRDFTADGSGNVTVSFDYRTAMSPSKANDTNGNAYGYYLGDPLKVPALNDGNFISGTDAGPNAPRDSFMVYVGSPVNDAAWVGANGGAPKPVYDKQRRWFSEVININAPYRRLFSATGVMGAAASSGALVAGGFTPGATVRVAFRVKTDRAFDDEDTYQRGFGSGSVGAVLLDNVIVNGNGPHGFNTASDIDNNIATLPSNTWKATGKPLASNWHWHNVEGGTPYTDLIYADPCGNIGGTRLCNMRGNAISAGNHDLAEKLNGGYGTWDQEHQDYFISPTINLRSTGNGPGFYNEVGIDQEIADANNDIRVRFDIFTHGFDLVSSGGGMRCAWNAYPAQQGALSGPQPVGITNAGVKVWSQRKPSAFSSYTFTFGCFSFANPSGANGRISNLIRTSNVNGVPDSLQAIIERLSVCFRNTGSVQVCGPDQTDPAGGGYIDNIAVGFVDGASAPLMAMAPWDAMQDAFPTNGDDALVGTPAFDRLTCLTGTGFNQSSSTGSLTRPVIQGDSMIVSVPGSNLRVDLVFRIYPGPGNYVTTGNRSSDLCRIPGAGCTQATAGDGSWWGTYLADVGLFGTSGPNVGPKSMDAASANVSGPTQWDPHCWVSTRMDTLERVTNDLTVQTGQYMSTIHERDYGGATPDGDPDNGRRSALASNEGVKILPNNLFTPGTHIEYFFRRTFIGNTTSFTMMPDTTLIYPQLQFSGGNFDGIRFATWDALPDRWKDPSFPGNAGTPSACMLVANYGSRRGDLVIWDNLSRTIGLTRVAKYGAGHGYYSSATGDLPESITDPAAQPANGGGVIAANLGHEGSMYDVYDVVAGESNVPAGRLGNRDALGGCPRPTGPSRKMLRTYYRNLIILAADLGQNLIGPFEDQTDDDTGLITDFITNSNPNVVRMTTMIGMDIGSGLDSKFVTRNLLNTQFGAVLKADDYRTDSGSSEDFPDLLTAGSPVITTGAIYGVFSPCFSLVDAFNVNGVVTGATVAASYENTGINDPWPSAIYTPENLGSGRQSKTLIAGWTLGAFGGPGTLAEGLGGQGSRFTITRGGMVFLWLNMLANMAQGCSVVDGVPVGIGDLPGQDGSPFVNFLGLRSENPTRSGTAVIAFGIVKKENVEVVIFDVAGRKVKKLADRVFEGGKNHELRWDGTSDDGRKVAGGVYFYQLRSPSFTSQKKLTVLRD
jgi:hypothetical protein